MNDEAQVLNMMVGFKRSELAEKAVMGLNLENDKRASPRAVVIADNPRKTLVT